MTQLLFSNSRLENYLGKRRREVEEEIEKLNYDYLLQVSEHDLIDYLVGKYTIEPITLLLDQKYQHEPKDVNIDVSGDHNRSIRNRSQPFYVKGTEIKISVPYLGDRNLFHFQASTYSFNPPRADVIEEEVVFIYHVTKSNFERLKDEINSDIGSLIKHLEWTNRDVGVFNNQLRSFIQDAVSHRKQKLLKDQDLSVSLGIPVKRRDNAPKTYSVPDIRRKLDIQRPSVKTTGPFKLEPSLPEQEYENILRILKNMVLVIERSPAAFSKMGEEDLRQQFLVQLNGQYEGLATGETFNFSGKTDILIRIEGKNVFIAECKFWRGPDHFSETIDQLLSYTSWRDTKTAILLFNRNKNFTDVLNKIPEIIEKHECYKRTRGMYDETTFRYVF